MMSPPATINIEITKRETKGLGYRVKDQGTKTPVVVNYIEPDGAAEQSGIRVGHVIIAVNGTSLIDLPYPNALSVLRAVPIGSSAVLTVVVPEDRKLPKQIIQKHNGIIHLNNNGKYQHDPKDDEAVLNGCVDESHEEKKDVADTQTRFAAFNELKKSALRCFTGTNNPQLDDHSKVTTEDSLPKEDMMATPVVNGVEFAKNEEKKISDKIDNKSVISNGVSKCPFSSQFRGENETEEKFFKLKNWENNEYCTDTLYKKSLKTIGCNPSRCLGSQMTPNALYRDPRTGRKSTEEMLELATNFIKEHFASFKRKNPEAEQKRLAEVVSSIETAGTYELNEKELIFGAKTAWRNASRCIGRIQWNKLHVMDCRHVNTTQEMYEAICKHLKYATNKGNIRSCITFFPAREDYKKEFRVWNPQYIRYAAYRQEDGSIVGDPANLEFTELCIKLGWKPKGGRFDLLPLVLSANGEDPDVYDLPPELVLEVKLRHPRFKWFEGLGYKWYAVPAVSNIMLDIGGVEFPGAPFNGWFMGTEIGRDLCDVSRYNILPEIAERMELDTKSSSSLWKDVALVEVNIAVLYSFQTDKITIMDHHVATESFMKHYANELRVRGGCPGDWVWLAPPLSSSATPIFHQEIINYYLNPACLYQPDPWKYHVWKGHTNGHSAKKAIRFKELAKSVLLASTMMSKAMANRVKATILYATETGKSHDYAKSLRDIFNHAFDAKVVCMEDYDITNLEYESLVLVVTSTFGNGDPPGNGEDFAQALVEEANQSHEQQLQQDASKVETKQKFNSVSSMAPLSRRSSKLKLGNFSQPDASFSGSLSNVRFSVFGLGSRAYPHFCAFAHAVDTLLGDMGGERLIEIGEGDELCGQEESFRTWAKEVFKVACETFCVGEDVSAEAASASVAGEDRSWNPNKFKVVNCQESEDDTCTSLSTLRRKKLSELHLVHRQNLQHKSSDRSTILVQLAYNNDDGMSYVPGDHLGVYPTNQPELVSGLIDRLEDSSMFKGVVELQMLEQKSTPVGMISNWNHYEKLPRCTLFNAFHRYLDITSCPSPQLMKILAGFATNPQQKERLEVLGQGEKEYDDWKYTKSPNLLEALEEFPSVEVQSSLLLSQLPPLQCRYYSISSSPDCNPEQVHLTVAVVAYKTNGGKGPIHHGVCSSFLNRVNQDENVVGFIRPARSFHLPNDPTLPCILIGPGTGIAPFRSFWQQRETMIKKGVQCGPMALIFGCRYPDKDHLYKYEIQQAVQSGAITEYHTAFSREPGKSKKYVQNILEEMGDTVVDWVVKKSGHFYVCGDVTMAADVGKALESILMKRENMTEAAVRLFVTNLKKSVRYHEDVFGVTLKTSEVTRKSRKLSMKRRLKMHFLIAGSRTTDIT